MGQITVSLTLTGTATEFAGLEVIAGGDNYLGGPIMRILADGAVVHEAEITASWPETEAVRVQGDFTGTLRIEFTNDLWDGTPETDRNLHVKAISLAGVPIVLASGVADNAQFVDGHWIYLSAGGVSWTLGAVPNRAPIWDNSDVEFIQGLPSSVNLRLRASDQDGDQLEISVVSGLLQPGAFQFDPATFDLAYDGSDLGAVEGVPVQIDSGIRLRADDRRG